MIELNTPQISKEKIIPIAGFLILLLASGAIFFLLGLPAKQEATRLQTNLTQEETMTQRMQERLALRPQLEARINALQAEAQRIQTLVPAVNEVTDLLIHLEKHLKGLPLAESSLRSSPLRPQGSGGGLIPIEWTARGEFSVLLGALEDLANGYPSLIMDYLVLEGVGDGLVRLSLTADLQVLTEKDPDLRWLPPEGTDPRRVPTPFGPPSQLILDLSQKSGQILGVVVTDSRRLALVRDQQGERRVFVGDEWGPGQIREISRQGIWLEVGGITLRLDMGGL